MASALDGIKVLDLTGIGPASLAAMMLGDLGADVIKIDLPPGGGSRGVGDGIDFMPQSGPEGERYAAYSAQCRNKRCLALNLKTEAGQQVFYRLAETSDVILESFRPGVMDRMNVGYQAMSGVNPRIVYCAVSGYGQTGPYSGLPGHDANYVSMGGVQGLIRAGDNEAPVFALNIVADLSAAFQNAVIGILTALLARERTGRGQMVDISMADGVVGLLAGIPEAAEYFYTGSAPRSAEMVLGGNRPYYAAYRTGDDRWLTLCSIEPKFWANLCRALDREDLIPLQFDATRNDDVVAELRRIFLTRSRDEWFDLLAKADVPVGKVLDLEEAFSDPQVLHRRMVIDVEHPKLGKVKQIGFGIKLSDTPGTIRRLGGVLGRDTDEVMAAAGYSPDQIDGLRRQAVIY